ncbi:hypothetical protein EMIHUDRAFT_249575 [Emiliania huxleyi CCMP1516]|uniref:Uncharacterized protein n=2 Tax=Emiliania huxleyi TaxID=2903 RepID=A0A0D3I801_EMIH1|nr:hypothetical protein EMIHUDRAFT_249575 [Emiliania huxleyi CCMP1516]EOD07386.1 hypothetical protein EMIHUDRAFT_249575 [Emiliania huxleyi CCMP1516]|eukprot:XP_005759815.1 hypothetical protein EMIHUDRAFT_249575 [Emiliania huxleyi CCMP1516]
MLNPHDAAGAQFPSSGEVTGNAHHPTGPAFYLQEHGGFDFANVAEGLRERGQSADDALHVGTTVELNLLPALSAHPLRTLDPASAQVHVLAALPFASHVLSLAEGDPSSHVRRMMAFAYELRKSRAFVEHQIPFVLIYPHSNPTLMGNEALAALSLGSLIVATSDPVFARPTRHELASAEFHQAYRRGITIPYLGSRNQAAAVGRKRAGPVGNDAWDKFQRRFGYKANPTGIATALLRELGVRLPSCHAPANGGLPTRHRSLCPYNPAAGGQASRRLSLSSGAAGLRARISSLGRTNGSAVARVATVHRRLALAVEMGAQIGWSLLLLSLLLIVPIAWAILSPPRDDYDEPPAPTDGNEEPTSPRSPLFRAKETRSDETKS